jgi:hypothetical protein
MADRRLSAAEPGQAGEEALSLPAVTTDGYSVSAA